MTYPAALFGLAFGLMFAAFCLSLESRRYRVKVVFFVIGCLCLVALVLLGVWQIRGPWPLIVWNPW